MCGIIGIASNKPVSMNIINSLKKLEYRGYDSAGLATLDKDKIIEKKCSGRVEELEKILFKTHNKTYMFSHMMTKNKGCLVVALFKKEICILKEEKAEHYLSFLQIQRNIYMF